MKKIIFTVNYMLKFLFGQIHKIILENKIILEHEIILEHKIILEY